MHKFNNPSQMDSLPQEKNLLNIPNQELSFLEDNSEKNFNLMLKNLHLVEKAMQTKRTDILSKVELRKYGILALCLAINDFTDLLGFENYALSKIESSMNRAVAEESYLKKIKGSSIKKDQIQAEFVSIHNRFSTLLF